MADWLDVDGSYYDSHCGNDGGYSPVVALNGTNFWMHNTTHTHWVVIDLGETYNVQKVRGRSNYTGQDPIDISIYVSDSKEDWGAAVASGISTWQDRTDWDGDAIIDVTPKDGRYLKIEIVDTEHASDYLVFGGTPGFKIFDAYGDVPTAEVLLAGVSAISSTTAGVLKATREIAGTSVIASTTAGVLKANKMLAGTSVISSTVTGELSIEAVKELAGVVAISSTVTGEIKLTQELIGTSMISTTTAGALTITGPKELAGTVVISTTTAGILKADKMLVGTVVIGSTTNGIIKLTQEFIGVVTIHCTTAGELTKVGIQLLAGVTAIKSTVTGILIISYSEIPPFMQEDLIDPYSGGAWLWLCEVAVSGYATKRLARNTEDVEYGGKTFDKFNIQIGEQMFSGDGSIPRVTVRIFQDANRIIEDMINATEGALGAAVKLIRVNEKYLDTPVAALEADYQNLATESDCEWVTFMLGIPNPLTQRFPLWLYSADSCEWATPTLFKGPECQYAGEDSSCTGTYADCYTKGNAVHWGGELGLDPNVVRV